MKHIYLLRHGKAVSPAGRMDHDRELAPRGQRDSRYIGEWMAARDLLPDHVLVSSAARTQETYARWSLGAQWEGTAETTEELYLASSYEICDRIAQLDDSLERILLIGHNPGLEMTVRELRLLFQDLGEIGLVNDVIRTMFLGSGLAFLVKI